MAASMPLVVPASIPVLASGLVAASSITPVSRGPASRGPPSSESGTHARAPLQTKPGMHSISGSVGRGTGEHCPTRVATAHDSHTPSQAASQHTPSTQLPLMHSLGKTQIEPGVPSGWQRIVAAQRVPAGHEVGVHGARQSSPAASHIAVAHTVPVAATHVPTASHVLAA